MKKVILFLVGIVFFLYGCTQSNINVIQKVESPNGKYVAYAHVGNGEQQHHLHLLFIL